MCIPVEGATDLFARCFTFQMIFMPHVLTLPTCPMQGVAVAVLGKEDCVDVFFQITLSRDGRPALQAADKASMTAEPSGCQGRKPRARIPERSLLESSSFTADDPC